MRKLAFLAVLAMFTLPAFCAEQTFKDAPILDTMCAKKLASSPDSHTKGCALQCQGGGFAIVTPDQKVLKLDSAGNKQVVEQLKSSSKNDHLRVDVTGDVNGDTLKVKSIKLL